MLKRIFSIIIGITFLSQPLLIFAQSANEYLKKAKTAMEQGGFDDVIAYSNKALELDPKNAEAYLYRGLGTMFKNSNFEQCLRDFTNAIIINPKLAGAYSARGGLYTLYMHEYDKAISDYNNAVALEPTNTCYLGDRSKAYLDNRNYDAAITDCNKIISLTKYPNNLGAYVLRAEIYSAKGDQGKAWGDIHTAQKSGYLLPDNIMEELQKTYASAQAYFDRAEIYLQKGKYDLAWADVHKAEELGYKIPAHFLEKLKKDSGRDK
jgi:tetratricopeptide (TPR) repeat protein